MDKTQVTDNGMPVNVTVTFNDGQDFTFENGVLISGPHKEKKLNFWERLKKWVNH